MRRPAVPADILGQDLRDGRTDVLAPIQQRADRLHDLLGNRVLRDVSVRAGAQQADGELLFRVHRQDQDRKLGLVRSNLPQQVDSRTVGQRDVEEEDVPGLVANALQRLLCRARLAGYGDVRFLGKQRLHALAEEGVIVGEEDPVRSADHRVAVMGDVQRQ